MTSKAVIRKFNPDGVAAPQFYSHGAEVSGAQKILYISGQIGALSDGSIAEGIEAQTAAAVANLKAVLAGAGMTTEDVVKYTFYLTDPAHLAGFGPAAAALLTTPPAATTLLYVKALSSPAMLVEIEAVAAK